MSADPSPGRSGADVSDVVDVLPEDLDASAVTVPVSFPDNDRRRIPAVLYLLLAAATIAFAVTRPDGSPFVDTGIYIAAGALVLFALYSWVAGVPLALDESEALAVAGAVIGFPVGHASAQMAWRGLLSRPVWRLLIFSDENPPVSRAMVIVDGCDGSVLEWFAEDNPEDWRASD